MQTREQVLDALGRAGELREWVMVDLAPSHNPKGYHRRHLRVRYDHTGPYVRIGKGARIKRYLDTMAYEVIDLKIDLRIYFETWPEFPARPGLRRPEYVRPVAAA